MRGFCALLIQENHAGYAVAEAAAGSAKLARGLSSAQVLSTTIVDGACLVRYMASVSGERLQLHVLLRRKFHAPSEHGKLA